MADWPQKRASIPMSASVTNRRRSTAYRPLLGVAEEKLLDMVYAGSERRLSVPSKIMSARASDAHSVTSLNGNSNGENGQHYLHQSHSFKAQGRGPVRVFELLEMLEATQNKQPTEPPDKRILAELYPLLCGFLFFQNFDEADGLAIAKLCERVSTVKGSTLFVQGDRQEDSIFFLLQGNVSIHFHDSASHEELRANASTLTKQQSIDRVPSAPKDQLFGKEIAVVGAGSVLNENAFLHARLQQCVPQTTGG